MDIETLRNHCIAKKGVTEGFPFGEQTLVFKVMGKMFALVSIDNAEFVNLKCEPEYALELREQYDGMIRPGWHMNKKLWNSVSLIDGLSYELIKSLIDHSYDEVVKTLKKKDKIALEEMES